MPVRSPEEELRNQLHRLELQRHQFVDELAVIKKQQLSDLTEIAKSVISTSEKGPYRRRRPRALRTEADVEEDLRILNNTLASLVLPVPSSVVLPLEVPPILLPAIPPVASMDTTHELLLKFQDGFSGPVSLPSITDRRQCGSYNKRQRTTNVKDAVLVQTLMPDDVGCDICAADKAFFLTCAYTTSEDEERFHNNLCFRCMGLQNCPLCRRADICFYPVVFVDGPVRLTYRLQYTQGVLSFMQNTGHS